MNLLAIFNLAFLLIYFFSVAVHCNILNYSSYELRSINLSLQGTDIRHDVISALKLLRIHNNERFNCKARKRGKQGGVILRNKRLKGKTPLPQVILSNVRSIRNKIDELRSLIKYDSDYRQSSIICLTETWLNSKDLDVMYNIDGFSLIRSDRDAVTSNKSCGGGIAFYIKKLWCTNYYIHSKLCTPHIELLALGLRPFYLPREFPQLFYMLVYIPPDADKNIAVSCISKMFNEIQVKSPNAPLFILGDFNHVTLSRHFPHLKQYVDCKSRNNKIIDLCYGQAKEYYKSCLSPPIGASDHNTIILRPSYIQLIKREKMEKIIVKDWTSESIVSLQQCFNDTDWSVFYNAVESFDTLCSTITDYINFCVESIIPTKEIKKYPNSKPWLNRNIRQKIRAKNEAFKTNDRHLYQEAKRNLDREIKFAKKSYAKSIEDKFKTGNMKIVWSNLNTISGQNKASNKVPNSQSKFIPTNDLNKFFSRFEADSPPNFLNSFGMNFKSTESLLVVSEDSVNSMFKHCKVDRAAGPDKIPGKLLRLFSDELTPVFTVLFNTSISTGEVPTLWKTSIISPVPKIPCPKVFNDYRPIALTPIVMKCLEKFIKQTILLQVSDRIDPLQFAYQAHIGVEDAIVTLLHIITKNLEISGTYIRILFVDFSSAFNTIRAKNLVEKLLKLNVDTHTIKWIISFMTGRVQKVKLDNKFSDEITTHTGCPQGCVLSPLLFILFTNDCRAIHNNCSILKFADDTALVGVIKNDHDLTNYYDDVNKFVLYCDNNHLDLNTTKTKEMIIDFRRCRPTQDHVQLKINSENIAFVEHYKYLGVTIDNKLRFDEHVTRVCAKAEGRIYILRQLSKFGINSAVLNLFYNSKILSVCSFSLLTYYHLLPLRERKRLNNIIKKSSRIVPGIVTLDSTVSKQITRKSLSIIHSRNHPLYSEFNLLPSGRRYCYPVIKNNRFRNSFIPQAVKLLNNSYK